MSPAVQCWTHIDTAEPFCTSRLPFGQKGPNRVRACQGTCPPALLPWAQAGRVSPAAAGAVYRDRRITCQVHGPLAGTRGPEGSGHLRSPHSAEGGTRPRSCESRRWCRSCWTASRAGSKPSFCHYVASFWRLPFLGHEMSRTYFPGYFEN